MRRQVNKGGCVFRHDIVVFKARYSKSSVESGSIYNILSDEFVNPIAITHHSGYVE